MSSLEKALVHIREISKNDSDLGKAFEKLSKIFLNVKKAKNLKNLIYRLATFNFEKLIF